MQIKSIIHEKITVTDNSEKKKCFPTDEHS